MGILHKVVLEDNEHNRAKVKVGIDERMEIFTRRMVARNKGKRFSSKGYKYKVSGPFLGKFKKQFPASYEELYEEVKVERAERHRPKKVKAANARWKPDEKRVLAELEQVAEAEEQNEANVVARELAQRELARRYLIASILKFNPDYLAGWVHKDICRRLEQFMRDVENGRSPRLLLQMPPRHGKSTIASQEFPAWVLGHHPEWELIVCSYAESLALDFSRAVRARVRDREFRALFPESKLDPENQNAKGWKTSRKGGFLPAGVEGPITGKGAHVLIIDDPIKNSQEAESELKRTSIINWYASTAYTRLAPGGGVLVIQTRWHLDDLSGRLEADMLEGNGDQWEVVRYPAIAVRDEENRQRGEPLHKARYDLSQLKMIRKAVGERTWAALYQQNPVPDEGAQFQQSMIRYWSNDPEKKLPKLPEQLKKATTWDLAIGQKEINDKTVGLTWGKSITGEFYFLDCRHGHIDAMEIINEICDSYVKHEPFTVGIEKDKVSMALGPLLDIAIQERELYKLHVTELRPAREGNKLERCRALQGLMRQGKVFLPHPDEAEWVDEFVTELLQFPYGRRDDHVDAAAWLALLAADIPSPGPKYSKVPTRESWRDRLRSMTRGPKTMMGA